MITYTNYKPGDKLAGDVERRAVHERLTTEDRRRDESGRPQLATGGVRSTRQNGMKKCRE